MFPGSHHSVSEASLAIFAFIVRFSLSLVGQKALLQLIKLLLPDNNKLPTTVRGLNSHVGLDKINILNKSFCDDCSGDLNAARMCSNNECRMKDKASTDPDLFSYVDFAPQLKSLVQHNFNIISEYLSDRRDFIDLIDGDYYKQIKRVNRLHLMCYTDGIQLVASGAYQCWPVVLSLVELPGWIRDSNLNKIICGIWFGKKKPSSEVLFNQLISTINEINQFGIDIKSGSSSFNLSFRLYGLLADTPAKSLCMMVTNFNGKFGCPYCLNPGINFDS